MLLDFFDPSEASVFSQSLKSSVIPQALFLHAKCFTDSVYQILWGLNFRNYFVILVTLPHKHETSWIRHCVYLEIRALFVA